VIAERTRGAVLYALTAVLLLGGGLWYVRAAPDVEIDPRIPAWRATAEERLPDRPLQEMSETVVLSGRLGTERSTPVNGGEYALSMICAGTGKVRVKVSSSGNDSGRAVACSDAPAVDRVQVSLAEEFYISLSAEDDDGGGAVFRWRLDRARRF
jgi:hypothetical protein